MSKEDPVERVIETLLDKFEVTLGTFFQIFSLFDILIVHCSCAEKGVRARLYVPAPINSWLSNTAKLESYKFIRDKTEVELKLERDSDGQNDTIDLVNG